MLQFHKLLDRTSPIRGGLEYTAAKKGLAEMLKVHPDAKLLSHDEFEALYEEWKVQFSHCLVRMYHIDM